MTPRDPHDRTSGEAPPGRAEAARRPHGETPPAALHSYLKALASALGRAPAETGRPIVAALRSLLQSAGEALGVVAPGAGPLVEPRARQGGRVAEPPPAPLVEPIERPGLVPARRALERLTAVARSPALGAVADLYPAPMALAEDIFLARCLLRDPPAALELAAMRDFLARAVVPERLSELAMDRTVSLEQISFATLWAEPHRLESMRATFEYFRGRFRAALLAQHASYWRDMRRLRLSLEDGEAAARALARLNSLEQLGRPLGEDALAQHGRLLAAVQDCPLVERLEDVLGVAASCPACGLTLADQPPSAEADAVLRRLSRALSQQMTRLSGEAVHRIIARARGERIEQFLQVVQASDLAGLVSVLDDELLEFLRDLLAGEPATAAPPVLDRLRRAFPIVSEGEIEAATEVFRRLLQQAISEQRRARPDRTPTVRLDLPAGQAGLPGRPAGGLDREPFEGGGDPAPGPSRTP
jgi:hypothetical protein